MGAVGERPRPGQQARAVHTVLVVEDEVLVRLMIADVIRSAGYEVIEAANADEALDVLAHTRGVSLIISDIRTPTSTRPGSLAYEYRTILQSISF